MDTATLGNYATSFFVVVSFVFGAVWGSFLNVCIYRIPAGKSVVFPGSHCTACGMPIRWYDNIPILSYFLLQGHCRTCGTYFSVRYAAIELLTAALFLLLWLRYPAQLIVISQWVIACLLIVATSTDIDHFIIPDSVSLGGLGFAIVATGLLGPNSFCAMDLEFWQGLLEFDPKPSMLSSSLARHFVVFLWSGIGATFGWLLLTAIALFGRVVFAKEAMGGGDVKLFAFLGAYFGISGVFAILFLSAVTGAVVGLAILAWHKLFCRDEIEELEFDESRAKYPPVRHDHLTSVSPDQQDSSSAAPSQQRKRIFRVARRTSRQLHHFPYGPYIAFAAVVLLFLYPDFQEWLRDHLWLIREPSW